MGRPGGRSKEAAPEVATARCTGCGRCVSACPARLFTLEVSGFRKHAFLETPRSCDRCLACVAACPVGALTFQEITPSGAAAGTERG